ncbi:MAG: GTP cyclohydrolase I FolE2 [Nitrososphaerota archaeon]|jgi:GTP cyclohydrolase FolE2|nr:GTP cyclohydrolase I FolE2 [Nitrososphaerota archaeon]MDG6966613.1 GTP cyclohydrolase I FolE2 [Nitrososphaerota archaeon]MDG6978528.1 GTP cyclohydrolase I FolE2 [Nitrososphaerota archaeon]MDG6981691.1 GTP cyclohydrolase I FolE2 [Nitrososphaerota archaeon]MDG7005661.1 GTP cyclohydrolase I FolE2 [Nitrososphaerota archaeon]
MRYGRGTGEDDAPVEALADSVGAPPNYIDTFADTQNEPAALAIDAGVSDLKVLYQNGKVALPVSLTIQTSTGLHRGVHMSRLVHAATSHSSPEIVSWLRMICKEVNKSQPGSSVACSFELPYADQFIPVSIRTSRSGAVRYRFTAKGMTACPCSKKMVGVGHMQRAEIVMILGGDAQLDMLKLVDKMEECFSAVPTEKMKRIDEAKKILEAQEHGRFAEDLVRECVRRFPNADYIRARCFESIHAHDAVATWSRKPGWLPEF